MKTNLSMTAGRQGMTLPSAALVVARVPIDGGGGWELGEGEEDAVQTLGPDWSRVIT